MPESQPLKGEIDEKFQTILSNANAARAVAQAIEGTIGPKGLDIMLVDRFGDVVISNDGVTILKMMDVKHPAARMLVNAAQAQQEEAGDGTTTATLIAGALVTEGASQVLRGVPVTQLIAGIQMGIKACLELIARHSRPLKSLSDPRILQAAIVAGRGEEELARLAVRGAQMTGWEKMMDRDYKYVDSILARESAENRVFMGVIVNKEPVNSDMPKCIEDACILVIDDALAPEEIDSEARGTEIGVRYYLENREIYESNLHKICAMGVNLVITDRGIDDLAEQIFTEAGVMAIQRVSRREIEKVCRHSAAKKIKRSSLNREAASLNSYLGRAGRVELNEKLHHTCILNGAGEAMTTLLIGAATEAVVDERERIARDAAAAVQAALQGGIVPGGGALEIWLAQELEGMARGVKGMVSYGILCVKEALVRPFTSMAANAGFNPLEKLGDIVAQQGKEVSDSISIDCDNGSLIDVMEEGVIDPTLVKIHAIKAAGEVATAILRISTIIKMKDEKTPDHHIKE